MGQSAGRAANWCTGLVVPAADLQYSMTWLVTNADVCRITEPPPHTSTIKSRQLLLFGHVVRMDRKANVNRILRTPLLGKHGPADDLTFFDMGLQEVRLTSDLYIALLCHNCACWYFVTMFGSEGYCRKIMASCLTGLMVPKVGISSGP